MEQYTKVVFLGSNGNWNTCCSHKFASKSLLMLLCPLRRGVMQKISNQSMMNDNSSNISENFSWVNALLQAKTLFNSSLLGAKWFFLQALRKCLGWHNSRWQIYSMNIWHHYNWAGYHADHLAWLGNDQSDPQLLVK
jgi:hypothetical protein